MKLSIINRSNNSDFIQKASRIHHNKYSYSKVDYISSETPVIIECPIHGEFLQTPHNHLNGRGCPKCNESHGERIITVYLDSLNIYYIKQYKVEVPTFIRKSGLIYIDFYLPDYNIFIEYNGIQHYTPQNHFGGQLKFQKQIMRDNWLRDYCSNKNIQLLEIKYNEDPKQVLENILKSI